MQLLTECLESVDRGDFDLLHVVSLFAQIRPLTDRPRIREIADSFAHPEVRTKGLIRREIHSKRLPLSTLLGKSPRIDLNRWPKDLYEDCLLHGLEQTDALYWFKLGWKKEEVRKLFAKSYVFRGRDYVITAFGLDNQLSLSVVVPHIVGVARFAGGPPYQQAKVIGDLEYTLHTIDKRAQVALHGRFMPGVRRHAAELLLCVMVHLQDAEFGLMDGEISRAFLLADPSRSDVFLSASFGRDPAFVIPIMTSDGLAAHLIEDVDRIVNSGMLVRVERRDGSLHAFPGANRNTPPPHP